MGGYIYPNIYPPRPPRSLSGQASSLSSPFGFFFFRVKTLYFGATYPYGAPKSSCSSTSLRRSSVFRPSLRSSPLCQASLFLARGGIYRSSFRGRGQATIVPPRQTSFSDGDGRLCLDLYPSYVHKQYEGLYRYSPWSNPTTESIPGVKFGLGGVERNGSPCRGIPKV